MASDTTEKGWLRRNGVIVGIAATVLVGVACLLLGAWWQKRSSRAVLYWNVTQSTVVGRLSDKRLRISFDGSPVDRVTVAYLRVANVGGVPVVWGAQVDAQDGMTLSPPAGATLLAVEIEKMSDAGVHAEVVPGDEKGPARWVTHSNTFDHGVLRAPEGESASLRFRSMNPGEWFLLRVTHTGDEASQPALYARMVGASLVHDDPVEAGRRRADLMWKVYTYLALALGVLMGLWTHCVEWLRRLIPRRQRLRKMGERRS